ncbi:MAG TPA: trypsin-like peptidase domain-containing protein [Planctomycetaceae bacterium]|nr:trypsin-like peptidase domain-containing protein [Planctomycetaceae bacterium]
MTHRLFATGLCWAALFAATTTVAQAENLRETALVLAVKRASGSVVNIHTEKTAVDRDAVFATGNAKPRKINGMGTGVVIDERGYIVTNYHVVAEVDLIRGTLDDGASLTARVIALDREHDLAIIKIDASRPLKVMPSGTSSDLMLGEPVIAVGNAFGYEGTVTSGIVSALSRDVEVNETQSYKNLIQTDASINPGNSGGPLLNMNGEVVGINVAIRAGAQRIGFAIPIDDARKIIARLMSIEQLNQTFHGLVSKDVKQGEVRKLVVDSVQPESPASKAGLQAGDIVVKIGDKPVVDGVDWELALLDRPVGDAIPLIVQRGDKSESLSLSLAPFHGGRSRMSTEFVARANNDNSDAERFWRILGLRLAPLPPERTSTIPGKYRGGLVVSDVRPNSPAAANGIKKDDVLVGLRDWETLTFENVSWILNQVLPSGQNSVKFYVIRGRETLYGYIQMVNADAPAK